MKNDVPRSVECRRCPQRVHVAAGSYSGRCEPTDRASTHGVDELGRPPSGTKRSGSTSPDDRHSFMGSFFHLVARPSYGGPWRSSTRCDRCRLECSEGRGVGELKVRLPPSPDRRTPSSPRSPGSPPDEHARNALSVDDSWAARPDPRAGVHGKNIDTHLQQYPIEHTLRAAPEAANEQRRSASGGEWRGLGRKAPAEPKDIETRRGQA